MYKQYLNDYEKKAERIRRAAEAVESGKPVFAAVPECLPEVPLPPVIKKEELPVIGNILERFALDDLILIGLILLLLNSEKSDMTLVLVLGYLFVVGL